MTLQSSPPISLDDIKGEFGLTGQPVGLTQLYRGAGIVPNSPANANVPTSGSIDLLDFLGASNQSVSLSNETISALSVSPADASASYRLNANGLVQGIRNGSTATEGTWLLGGSAGAFEVRATTVSGSLDSGTTGSWLNMGSTHTWTRTRTADTSGTSQWTGTIEIRDVATQTLQASATVTLEAEVVV